MQAKRFSGLEKNQAVKKSNAKIGSELENFLIKWLPFKGYSVTRIPDGCKQLGQGKIIRVKSPFDFLVTGPNKFAVFFDAKSCNSDNFPYSKINQLQLRDLSNIAKNGHLSGYLIHFKVSNVFGFITAQKLSQCPQRASISVNEAIDLGKDIDLQRISI